jgi:RHS repeat-associated protein
VTRWQYGTTLATDGIATSNLLSLKIYPDDTPSAPDRVPYTYTRQQLLRTKTDQNGNTHTYEYDAHGRATADIISTLGASVEGAVRRFEIIYDDLVRATDAVSFDTASDGNVVNAVKFAYNGFGQLLTDSQEHIGTVATNTLAVNYEYVNGQNNCTTWLGTNYPDYRQIEAVFNTKIDEFLGRPGSLHDSVTGGNIADYSYLGKDTVINALYPESNVMLSYLQYGRTPVGDGGDQYDGLDRFGRIVDQRWQKWVSGQPLLDRYKYTYNRGSLRLTRANLLSAAQPTPVYLDELYSYDGLNQIRDRQLGQLSPDNTSIIGTAAQQEDWYFDPAGNWQKYQQENNGATTIRQERTHNEVNEITAIDSSGATVTFDPAGNMTTVPSDPAAAQTPFSATYDAWNRLVRVQGGPNAIDIHYEYDALSRRTRQLVTVGASPSLDFYYNNDWKIIEERIIDLNGAKDSPIRPATPLPVTTKIRAQYVYGVRNRNDLILRDYSADDGTTPTRHYVLSDAMFSTTAIADSTGAITQRFRYTAFGIPTHVAPDFTDAPVNPANWQVLLHGEYYDEDTIWSNYGYRFLEPALGRWEKRDIIEETDDINLYTVCGNNLINRLDSLGLGLFGSSYCSTSCALKCFAPFGGGIPCLAACSLMKKIFCTKIDYSPCKFYPPKAPPCCENGLLREDTYLKRAKDICLRFMEMYPESTSAACVARCLGKQEHQIEKEKKCACRNALRLEAHFLCYASCIFLPEPLFPNFGIPDGGWKLGIGELLKDIRGCEKS